MNKILFFLNVVIISAIVAVVAVYAWNSPNNNPPYSTNQVMYVNSSGNVGIGTTAPSQKLDVNGYINGSGLCIGNNCRYDWKPIRATISNSVTFNNGTGVAYVYCPSGYIVTGCQGFYPWYCYGSWACEYQGGWFSGNGCGAQAYSDGNVGASTVYVYINCLYF